MKKLSIIILLFLICGAVYAQEPLVTWEGLVKQKEKSNEDIADAKKGIMSKTWASRAELLLTIHTFELAGLYKGMPSSGSGISVEALFGKPGKKMKLDDGEIWVYSRKNLTIKNNLLDSWEQTEFIVEDAINMAAEAYLMAVKYDEKGKFKEKNTSKDLLATIKNGTINEAITYYTKEDYKNAYKLMNNGYELMKLPKNETDTNFVDDQVLYYLGVIAYNAKEYDDAMKHFNQSIQNNYNPGFSYHYVAECFAGKGDSTKFIEKVKEGFEKYPDEEQLIIDLINYYLIKNKTNEAIQYIDVAINKNPENPSYYSAKATIYDNGTEALFEDYKIHMEAAYEFKKEAFRERNNPKKKAEADKKKDEEEKKALDIVKKIEDDLSKAEELYKKSLEIQPKFFNAAYNIGRIYLKRNERNALHADYILKITMPKDFTKAAEFENLAKDQLKTSAEKFEKALEINPKDRDVLNVLKRIYFRLRDQENQDRIDAKINELGEENGKNIK